VIAVKLENAYLHWSYRFQHQRHPKGRGQASIGVWRGARPTHPERLGWSRSISRATHTFAPAKIQAPMLSA
jgi:hypothetical protein